MCTHRNKEADNLGEIFTIYGRAERCDAFREFFFDRKITMFKSPSKIDVPGMRYFRISTIL